MDEKDKKQEVPFYIHEAVCDKIERVGKEALENLKQTTSESMSKMDRSNKRMLVALMTVCITLLIAIFGFLTTYKSMTGTWIGFINSHFSEEVETEEVENDGLFVQGNSTDDYGSLEE